LKYFNGVFASCAPVDVAVKFVYQIKTLAVLGQHLVINEKTTKIICEATNQEDMQQVTHEDDNTTLNHNPSPAPL
jgi:hypothetical protein